MSLLENINKKLDEINNLKNELFLPSKDDYENSYDIDSYKRSLQQKRNWVKYRHRIQTGIDTNARNNYTQGIYQNDNNIRKKENAYRGKNAYKDWTGS